MYFPSLSLRWQKQYLTTEHNFPFKYKRNKLALIYNLAAWATSTFKFLAE